MPVQTQNSLVFTQGPKIDVKEYFSNLLYENEREIFQSMAESYPNSFQNYESIFQSYNYNDLCLSSENARDIISQFFKVGMTNEDIFKAINSSLMKTSIN